MSSGYDTPIESEDDDVLGRASFAREIARLAGSSPQRWGMRIGVYGRWGEGKSSVLKMSARQLRQNGHLVAEFNPWGCTTAEEMVELLADSLIQAAKAEERQVEGGTTRLAKKAAKIAARAGESLGDYGKALSPWLDRWGKDRKQDIERVVASLGDEGRLIVLVDDVDRVDPKVLPKLFFALHEVFAFPGLSFILALDPEVVGAALADYHAGFKSGSEFLAKIVQFPRWLPEPSDEALRSLARRDCEQFAPFLDPSVLAQEASVLPTNPRELRSFVRGLWRLKAEVERHDADEIDMHLLVIVEALRQQSPELLRALLRDQDVFSLGVAALIRPAKREEYTQKVRTLIGEVGVRDADRAIQLALALCGRSLLWNADKVRYHAFIGERPHAVTWREFRSLLKSTEEAARTEWVRAHASVRGVSQRAVGHECIESCTMGYANELDKAALTRPEEHHRVRIEHAAGILDLLEWLWFTSDAGVAARSAKLFHKILLICEEWGHFDLINEDKRQRGRERALLERMAKEASEPLDYLEELAPWVFRPQHHSEAKDLRGTILNELESNAASQILPLFKKPSGISGCLFGTRVSERYLLVRHAPMWSDERKAALAKIVDDGNETVSENCRILLGAITAPDNFRLSVQPDVNQDHELLRILWRGICAIPVQARFFSGLAQLREQLGKLLGEPLPDPDWWDRVSRLAQNTDG